jgi:hypothetical protein
MVERIKLNLFSSFESIRIAEDLQHSIIIERNLQCLAIVKKSTISERIFPRFLAYRAVTIAVAPLRHHQMRCHDCL